MGNNHNLFGIPHEAHIHIDEDGYLIKKVIRGTTVGEAVASARYERGQLHEGFRRQIAHRVKRGDLSQAEAAEVVDFYESRIGAYTYLSVNGKQRR
jgi:arginine decarboxylase